MNEREIRRVLRSRQRTVWPWWAVAVFWLLVLGFCAAVYFNVWA